MSKKIERFETVNEVVKALKDLKEIVGGEASVKFVRGTATGTSANGDSLKGIRVAQVHVNFRGTRRSAEVVAEWTESAAMTDESIKNASLRLSKTNTPASVEKYVSRLKKVRETAQNSLDRFGPTVRIDTEVHLS